MIGTLLAGRYLIVEEIGRGGMGVVYRAEDQKLPRVVAVKVISPDKLGDESLRKRFRKEALHLAPLTHPNVVMILDAGSDGGHEYLVMEYVPGETLSDMLKAGPLAESKAVDLGLQLCDGLAAAHAQGLMHRDLKPGNLRVMPSGRLRILDFGLAKWLQESTGGTDSEYLTAPQAAMGTLPYMAPEQLAGGPVDERVDIYATGAVLYEMITGRGLFPGRGGDALRYSILNEAPARPRTVNPRISSGLEKVVLKAIEKNPDLRNRSAVELTDALRKVAPKGTSLPLAWILTGLVLVSAGLLVPVALRQGCTRPPRHTMIAVLPFRNMSSDPDQAYFAEAMTDEMIKQIGRLDPGRLGVLGGQSVRRYKDTTKDVNQIGRELRVDYLLDGNLQRVGPQVRISVQLNQVGDQTVRWGDDFDDSWKDVLALQSKVSTWVADHIQLALAPDVRARLAHPAPVDSLAYEAYLKGRYYWNRRDEDAVTTAIQYFDQAIARDPSYAAAHAGLADCYLTMFEYGFRRPQETIPRAREEAEKAIALDDSAAEAHASLGSILEREWNWDGAEREFRRTIALDPNYATGHQWFGEYLLAVGRVDAAREEIKKARRLEPLLPIINSDLGTYYLCARDYNNAIASFQEAARLDSTFYAVYIPWAVTLLKMGRGAESVQKVQTLLTLRNVSAANIDSLGQAFAGRGAPGLWRWIVEYLTDMASKGFRVGDYTMAQFHAMAGDRERAFEWLDRAFQEEPTLVTAIRYDPMLDSLRGDPRFAGYLSRMRFPT